MSDNNVLRAMVDLRDVQVQKARIQFGNRLSAIQRAADDDPNANQRQLVEKWMRRFAELERELGEDIAAEAAQETEELRRLMENYRRAAEKKLTRLSDVWTVVLLKMYGDFPEEYIKGAVNNYLNLGPDIRPTVVCLCGSTKFYEAFQEANFRETMEGKIVLSVGFFMHRPEMVPVHGETVGITSEQKVALDQLHLRKIDLADEVLVINPGGYIGESTDNEIRYAIRHGKVVRWLEEPDQDTTMRYYPELASLAGGGDPLLWKLMEPKLRQWDQEWQEWEEANRGKYVNR